MSKTIKSDKFLSFLIFIFSLFFVATGLVMAKQVTILEASSDTAYIRGAVGIGSSTPTAALAIDASTVEKQMAINTGSGGISMGYAAINDNDVINKAYLSSLTVAASKVSNGTFGADAGNGDYTFPENLTVTGLGNEISSQMVVVDSTGRMSATTLLAYPPGTTNYTLRHNGTSWVSNNGLTNNGSDVEIARHLTVNGNITIEGEAGYLELDESTTLYFGAGNGMAMSHQAGSPFVMQTGSDVGMMVGSVGIGKTNPSRKLDVSGAIAATDYYSGANQGITGTIAVRNSSGSGSCTITVSDGLIVSENCP